MWVLTVSSLRPSSRAATVVDSPFGEQLEDFALAAGQLAAAARRRHRRVDEALLGERRADGALQLLGAGGAGDVGAGAGLQGGVGEVAVGPLAVGDDAEARLRFAQRADRRRCRPGPPSASAAHRRMSTIATSKLPMSRTRSTRLGPARHLVDLEAVLEGVAHAEAHERVAVDHQAMWALAQEGSDRFAVSTPGTGSGWDAGPPARS